MSARTKTSPFLSFLVNRPFRYLDHEDVKTIAPSFPDHLGWSPDFAAILKERIIPNPHGGYLLTSQMLPGLADLSALLHHLERATFIGEETAGGYYGNSGIGIVGIIGILLILYLLFGHPAFLGP